ncbi:MAG: rod-binding protein [Nitrospinota bacterium]
MSDITAIGGITSRMIPSINLDPGTKIQQLQDTVAKIETEEETEDRLKELKDVSKEFESLFIHQMLKAMRKTVLKSDLLHRGMAEDIYNSMFDQEIARNISDSKGIGISSMIFQQLKVYKGFVDIK